MEGIIINYRGSKQLMNPYQVIMDPVGVKGKDAKKLIGKKVIYTNEQGKKMTGKILATHGDKGAVRAKFSRGVPGQAIGKKVQIVE